MHCNYSSRLHIYLEIRVGTVLVAVKLLSRISSYRWWYVTNQGCATGGLRATTRPAKPFSVALANTL